MSETPSAVAPRNGHGPDTPATPDEIRRQIEQTRQELGETIEALSAKTDVKRQLHTRLEVVKTRAQERREQIAIGAAAGLGVLTATMLLRRRSSRRR